MVEMKTGCIARQVIFALAAPLLAGHVEAATVPVGPLSFTVLRNGDEIGSDVLTFDRQSDRLVVHIKTDIAVKIAFITVYHFQHRSREVWTNGQLTYIESTTDDDGTKHSLRAEAQRGELVVDGDNKRSVVPARIVPASLWDHDIVTSRTLLNTLNGTQMAINVSDRGPEQVMVRGRSTTARHFVLTGQLERELWYDDAGMLVQAKFKGSDGSNIIYALR
jgi:hypothetical protein